MAITFKISCGELDSFAYVDDLDLGLSQWGGKFTNIDVKSGFCLLCGTETVFVQSRDTVSCS